MYYDSYPTFEEIKKNLTKKDLLEIIEMAMDSDLETAITNFIEAEYEPTKEIDYDYSYDCYRDEILMGA